MARVVEIEDGFWNIRGSFKLLGLVDLGTQASLVRLSSGGFALLAERFEKTLARHEAAA